MTLLDTLERRFGKFAIPGLIRIIVAFNALVYMLGKINPEILRTLSLNPAAIMQGEVWRVVTFLFIPDTDHPFFILMFLLFLWSIGPALEMVWGSFRLTLFYLVGAAGTVCAAMLLGVGLPTDLLNLSLLFAYARFFPDVRLLFPPIPMRWLAWILFGLLMLQFLSGPLALKAAIVISLSNYLLFFGPEYLRNLRQSQSAAQRKAKFQAVSRIPEAETLHRCSTCGRTERSHPELDFRVSANGNEYCTEHLPSRGNPSAL